MQLPTIAEQQKQYFQSGQTLSLDFRKGALVKLRQAITTNQPEIVSALQADLGKSEFESYMTEIGLVLSEITYVLKHLSRWAKPQRVPTPFPSFPGKSRIYKEPYGSVLIMAPWNYPFQLCMMPLIGAIAAGNCAVIKPSAYAPFTSAVVQTLIEQAFLSEYISVITGGRAENNELLEQPFSFIFFTGGATVGKWVLQKASERLTPVCLELGGKSPCLIGPGCSLKLAARRIIFGKCLNAGQTCVAPDYILVPEDKLDAFVKHAQKQIVSMYGAQPLQNPDYPKIINQTHYHRLEALLSQGEILWGGQGDGAKIEPTLMANVPADSPLLWEEIFGPILPILPYTDLQEALAFIQARPDPLAFYLFTNDKGLEQTVLAQIPFGGGCINDTILHLSNEHLGFGGIGQSGMGQYHGKKSFDTFTHEKGIFKSSTFFDLPFRYFPASARKIRLLKKALK